MNYINRTLCLGHELNSKTLLNLYNFFCADYLPENRCRNSGLFSRLYFHSCPFPTISSVMLFDIKRILSFFNSTKKFINIHEKLFSRK